MLSTSTLRPGLLVSLKTSTRGNVKYDRRDIEREKANAKGKSHSKWETERTIEDVKEYEAAQKARSAASAVIRHVCSASAFGLLCPESNIDELKSAVDEANGIIAAFNETANLTRVSLYVLSARVAQDDVQAMRAINSEISDLLKKMQDGVKNLDVKSIREAAGKARGLGQMLTQDAQVKVQFAIDAARKAARQMVKSGEQAANEIDQKALRQITESRTAFLDLDEAKEIAKPKARGRAVDLVASEAAVDTKKRKTKTREIDLASSK